MNVVEVEYEKTLYQHKSHSYFKMLKGLSQVQKS